MPKHEDPLTGLPEVWRNADRPIIIYNGPAQFEETATTNALGQLFWLALITLCLVVAGFCAWGVWNPAFDKKQFSPIYIEGRPVGLLKQIEERRQVNAWANGLIEFRDLVRADNAARRRSTLTHPLLTDRQGIDADHQGIDGLRAQWDAMCRNIRDRIYDRRIGQLDARIVALRQQRLLAATPAERAPVDRALQSLEGQRDSELERRRTGGDPNLRCTPAAQSATCAPSDDNEWCNPRVRHPEEFTDLEQ
ncbi:MAG: hypothetical protein AB7L65_00560 [Hyphomonadaceae bacterium]